MDIQQISARLQPLAERTEGLRLLVLVGSHARGHAHDRSDVDLTYVAEPHLDLGLFIGEVTMALGTDDVDVADLERANALFRFEAADTGIRLYGDPDEWFDLRFEIVSYWCDAGPIIRAHYDDTLAALG